jgi:Zn-dependent protease
MLDLFFGSPLLFLLSAAGLIICLTIHEFAHAWAADRLGDPTPRMQGRLTLNPLAHLDPLGTIAMLLTRFGWGKPVVYDPYNLKDPIRDGALIAVAGPVSNILLGTLCGILLKSGILPGIFFQSLALQLLITNFALALFNFIPVYPLDGSKVLVAILPRDLSIEYDHVMRRYGFVILLALIFPLIGGVSAVSLLVSPPLNMIISFFTS